LRWVRPRAGCFLDMATLDEQRVEIGGDSLTCRTDGAEGEFCCIGGEPDQQAEHAADRFNVGLGEFCYGAEQAGLARGYAQELRAATHVDRPRGDR
jgi:hypothetical protein